ncbi:MAG: FliH/SctL family protein [bacterium]
MSRDVIKRAEFVPLDLTAARAEDAEPQRMGSARARLRGLFEALDRAESEASRRAAEAAERARAETRKDLARQVSEALVAVQAAAKALAEARAREKEVAVEEIVHLAVAVAGKIVRREVRRDDDYVVRLVRRCLRRIPMPAPVRVRLHPDDIAAVTAARDALALDDSGHQVALEADRRVERGGCVVETPDFVVDGRARTQLSAARAAMEDDA